MFTPVLRQNTFCLVVVGTCRPGPDGVLRPVSVMDFSGTTFYLKEAQKDY